MKRGRSAESARARGASPRVWVILALGYVGLIFFMSSRPYLQAPGPEFELKDKLAHGIEYAILGALLARIVVARLVRPLAVSFLLVLAVAGSIASADEMFQGTVPGRQRDIKDWIADVTGSAVGAGAVLLMTRRGRITTEDDES